MSHPKQLDRRLRFSAPNASCVALSACVAIVAGYALAFAQPGDGPLSIQRIVVPPERIGAELEKARQGTLLFLPRPEFEARLARANLAVKAREQKPHLLRGHYSAELVDRAWTNGSGQWTVRHTGAQAVLPIDPFNLAVGKIKWEQGSDAVLAECDGRTLGVVVSHTGMAACLFDWSARGTPTTDGIAFTIAVPPCPLSTFEFTAPADTWLAAPKSDAVVTGPHEIDSSSKRLWKVQVTGAKPIDLIVRKIAEGKGKGSSPTVFTRVLSTQRLRPERADMEHEFHVDVLHGSVRELQLEGGASLQPYQVTLASGDLKGWQWQELPARKDAKGQPVPASGLLTIQFHRPMQGKLPVLRVRSIGAQPAFGLWTSPTLRLHGALPRGETLELHIHPDWPAGKWDYSAFQPTAVSSDGEGTQVLTLVQTADDGAQARRPTLTLPARQLDLHTTERIAWELTPRGATLNAEIHYAPARGNLFELRLKLPKTFPGYQVEAVAVQPAELFGGWHQDGEFLVVELKQALGPTRKATLKVRLRSAFRTLAAAIRVLTCPDLEPVDSTKRAGTLTIHVDPVFRSQLVSSSIPLAPSGDAAGSRLDGTSSFRFTYRDQRPAVAVRLIPQPVQTELRGKHNVTLTEQGARLQLRWEAQPLVGAPEFLDFRMGPGFPSAWSIKDEEEGSLRIHHWERQHLAEALPHLLGLGVGHGPGFAALEALTPAGTYWRFHLSEPLTKPARFTLEAIAPGGQLEDHWRRLSLQMPSAQAFECLGGNLAQAALPAPSSVKAWSVPLMAPAAGANVEQEITLDSPGEAIERFVADPALTPARAPLAPERVGSQLRLRQDGAARSPGTLRLWTRPEKRAASQRELCDQARLATSIFRDGRIYHRLEFRLWHWHEPTCEVKFPREFQPVAVKVQDRWLQGLDIMPAAQRTTLTLPVDQNAEFMKYEILARWTADETITPGLRHITVPSVALPIAPIDMRHRYFLEDGVMPLEIGALAPVGVPLGVAEQSPLARRLRQAWGWRPSWWQVGLAGESSTELESQRQTVLLAEAHMRAAAPKTMKLSDALERLALDHLKVQAPLVIDQVAFRSLGLTGDTRVALSGRPFWEALGLVYVPCPRGALLTSPRRLRDFRIDGPADTAVLDAALTEAVQHGRDASAGFYLVVAWLNLLPEDRAGGGPVANSSAGENATDVAELTEWDAIAVDGFHVVDVGMVQWAGLALAVLAGMLIWRIQRGAARVTSFRILALLLAGTAVAAVWAPLLIREYLLVPTLLVELAIFVWCLVGLIRHSADPAVAGNSTVSHPGAGAAALGLVLLSLTWNVAAQVPAAKTHSVLMIDGAKPGVLVTPDLMARLDELESPVAPGAPTAVLRSAKYAGKVNDTLATFEVQYDVFSFSDKSALLIPLAGVQLGEEAFLDGAPVFPAPHKNGYSLPIRGKGAHHLRLAFSTRAIAESEHVDLGFTMPRLAQNDISVQWPVPVQAVHCFRSLGEERVVVDARRFVSEWHGQVGYERNLKLRWTNAGEAAATPLETRESHFWDLRPGALTVISSLQYSIGKGSLSQVVVAVPDGLHVRGVDALVSPSGGLATPILVKRWQVAGAGDQQRLLVEFAPPVTGQLTLNLDLVPPASGQRNKILALPAPLQGDSKGGVLGYRLDAVEAQRKIQNLVAVASIGTDEFELQWKKQTGVNLPAGPALSRAYSFQRKAAKAWMELITQPDAQQAQGQLNWTIDRHYADLHGKLTILSPQEDLTFLELHVDSALVLADVTGADVSRWHVQDSRLQVWLRQQRKETTIELFGWRAQPAKQIPAKEQPFALPCIYPLQTQLGGISLQVQSPPGTHLRLEKANRLRSSGPPASGKGAAKLAFKIEEGPYEATFKLIFETAPIDAAIMTKVHASNDGIEIRHDIRLTTQRGQVPTLKLHVKDWPDGPISVDAPGAVVLPVPGKTSAGKAWTLKYSAGQPYDVVVTVRGRVARAKHSSMILPTVEIDGANVRNHVVAWQGVEIERQDGGTKLIHQKTVADSQTAGSASDLSSWNYANSERGLRAVLPRIAAHTVGVLAASENMRIGGAGRWLHEAAYWVQTTEASSLQFRFPAPVANLSAWTDGRLNSAWQGVGRAFTLPLDAGPTTGLLELRWQYEPGAERMDEPNLTAVQLEPPLQAVVQRVVWAPAGMRAIDADTFIPRLAHRAAEQIELSAALAQEPVRTRAIKNRIIACQQAVGACLRHADYAVSLLDDGQLEWKSRIAALAQKNIRLANAHRYNDERKSAEKIRGTAAAPVPASLGIPMIVSAGGPRPVWQSLHLQTRAEHRTLSYLCVLAAIFLWIGSCIRHVWTLLRVASPEIAILLLGAAMYVFGISLPAAGLLVMMAGVRILWLARCLQHRMTAPAAPAPSSELQPPPA